MSRLDTKLTDLANAIRTKTGVTGPLSLDDMVDSVIKFFAAATEVDDTIFLERKLEKYEIPSGISRIENGVFFGCNVLKSVIIPNGVASIGNSAFEGCESLTSIILPESVISIGEFAFFGCSSLTDIYCGFTEGTVNGAPWGAPQNVNIHYNT